VLGGEPVAVRVLHVGQHVGLRPVGGDEDYLDSRGVGQLLEEVLQHGSELSAGRAPVGREVEQDDLLVAEHGVGRDGGAVGLDEGGSGQAVHAVDDVDGSRDE